MGAMKELFTTIEEHLRAGEFTEALTLLEPWGDDIPNQLAGAILAISGSQDDILPSHYLPRTMRNKTITVKQLKAIAKDLETQGISAMNLALVLDMVEREASA